MPELALRILPPPLLRTRKIGLGGTGSGYLIERHALAYRHAWGIFASAFFEPLFYLLFAAAVIFFCYFYVSIVFNPSEAADNLRKSGGFVAGLRPGSETARYFDSTLSRLTLMGGIYLAALCLIPDIMLTGIHLQHIPLIGNFFDKYSPRFLLEGLNVSFYFGGTSLLIVVGVAMDTINQIEAQLIMRHYEGFTPRAGRIRGRRSSY